jgi:hypothetical protein
LANRAVEERKRTKQDMAALRAVLDAPPTEQPATKAGKPLGIDDLPALRNALDKIGQDLRRAETEAEIARRQQGRQQPDMAALGSALATAESDASEAAAAFQAAAEQHRQATKPVQVLETETHALAGERDALQRQIGAMKEGACATCGAKWTEARLKARREPLEQRLAGVLDAIEANRAKLDAAMEERNAARSGEYAAQEQVRATENEIARARRNLQEGEAWEAPGCLADLEAEVEKLKAQAERGESVVTQMERWGREQVARARMEACTALLDNLEWAVGAFRDGAFQATRMAGPREAFESNCNDALAQFGMALQVVQHDGHVRVEVKRADAWVTVPQLSKGERTLVEAVVALAYNPGAIICLDDLDALDSANKQGLLDLLKGSGASVVCAGAWGLRDRNLEPLAAYLDGAVVWVGDRQRQEVAA